MHRRLRPLVMAAALNVTAGTSIAAAQIVMIRNGPPSTNVEVLLNGAPVGTGVTNGDGEATVPLKTGTAIGEKGIDTNIFVDVCDKLRRVQIVDRTKIVPAAGDTCDRREISGIFWVRKVNTIVFDLGGPAPSLLLVRGSYTYVAPRDEDAPHNWRPLPTGLVVFGGAGYAKLSTIYSQACGNASPCSGTNSGLGGYTLGVTFWVKRWIGAEASYVKPRNMKATGGDTYSFTTTQNTDIFTVAGTGGVSAGPVRFFGKAGFNYTYGTWSNSETINLVTQVSQYKTHGWSYVWGGGAEIWIWKKIAIYGDLGVIHAKGNADTGGEAQLDDTVRYLFSGVKFSLTPK